VNFYWNETDVGRRDVWGFREGQCVRPM